METTPKSMEAPAAKPRNKNLILVGIVIIVLIVVGAGVYAYINTGSTTPQGTKFTMWDVGAVCSNATQCGFKDPSGNVLLLLYSSRLHARKNSDPVRPSSRATITPFFGDSFRYDALCKFVHCMSAIPCLTFQSEPRNSSMTPSRDSLQSTEAK